MAVCCSVLQRVAVYSISRHLLRDLLIGIILLGEIHWSIHESFPLSETIRPPNLIKLHTCHFGYVGVLMVGLRVCVCMIRVGVCGHYLCVCERVCVRGPHEQPNISKIRSMKHSFSNNTPNTKKQDTLSLIPSHSHTYVSQYVSMHIAVCSSV